MSSEKLIRKGLLSELNYYSTLTQAQYYHHIIYCSCYNWNLFKLVNIYHRYPNKIFIIPIMTISILHIGCSVMAKLPIYKKIDYCSISCPVKIKKIFN